MKWIERLTIKIGELNAAHTAFVLRGAAQS
jgi:hypothetical protein